MLLRFSVTNHLSMKDAQALSLVASSLKDVEDGLLASPAAPGGRVLPAAVIYGANASGKSNVVAALRFMRQAVLLSHSRAEPGDRIPRTPFGLDPACTKAPSTLSADFVTGGIRYHYGFEASDEAFTAEWLDSFPRGRRQTLFERNGQRFAFGRSLRGRNKIIADLTRPNSLFVSAAAQNDHEELSKISDWFRSVRSHSAIDIPSEVASTVIGKNEMDARILTFLEKIGTGVINYRLREIEVPENVQGLHRELLAVAEKFGASVSADPTEDRVVELAHRGQSGEPVYFDLQRESAGTRRLLILLGLTFRALDEGTVVVIDELDASLHTQACEAVLALFSSQEANPRGAQLITTTHDTNLLRSPLLRRDQIWFTEKDPEGGTHLYPLTEIRTRRGDNIERGYLQGRYGAIPFSGRVSDLITSV